MYTAITATVYEAEASANARAQGGMLDIHEHNGQLALARLRASLKSSSGSSTPADSKRGCSTRQATSCWMIPTTARAVGPRCRGGSYAASCWTHFPPVRSAGDTKVAAVSALGGGRHGLAFADGSKVTTDLLVGADGAWSKSSSRLFPRRNLMYVGTTFIETYLFDSDTRHQAERGKPSAVARCSPSHREKRSRHTASLAGVLHTYIALNKPKRLDGPASTFPTGRLLWPASPGSSMTGLRR